MAWTKEWAREGVKADWHKLLPPEGFQVLPRRLVVERSSSWTDPEQEAEQRLRALVGERRSVRICCHDSPHAEGLSRLRGLFIQSLYDVG
jgi:hypothetical protein